MSQSGFLASVLRLKANKETAGARAGVNGNQPAALADVDDSPNSPDDAAAGRRRRTGGRRPVALDTPTSPPAGADLPRDPEALHQLVLSAQAESVRIQTALDAAV